LRDLQSGKSHQFINGLKGFRAPSTV